MCLIFPGANDNWLGATTSVQIESAIIITGMTLSVKSTPRRAIFFMHQTKQEATCSFFRGTKVFR